MNSLQKESNYFTGLDGLRGISCLIVVLTHNFGFSIFHHYGWLGVDLFFVISGFLITNILLKTLNSKNYLKNFYLRRVLRIFPLYYLLLIIFILILPQFDFLGQSIQYFPENQLWFWLYAQNWLFIFNFPKAEYLNHFWSLAVEEQFYLLWPLVILWLKKPKKLIIFMLFLLAGLLLIRSILWYLKIEGFNYTVFYNFTRIDGLCIGCLVALAYSIDSNFISKNIAILTVSLAALNFLFYFLNELNQYRFPYLAYVGYTTFSALLGLLVNEIIHNKSKWINAIFSFPLLRFIGKISYSLYVFHWPVYLLSRKYFFAFCVNTLHLSEANSKLGVSLLSTGLGFIISIISYYSFESFFLRLKHKFN